MPKTQKIADLLNDPIGSTLLKMTVPVIFGMVTLMTFNLIDTLFVSLLGTDPLAAISFTFPVSFTVISLTIGLGIGTSAVIGKVMGAGKIDEARQDGFGALLLSLVLVACLSSAGYWLIDPLFTLLGAEPKLLPLIHDYMEVWFIGSVFLICPMVGNSIMRGFGDTKTPGLVMGFGAIINAALDPLFIFGLGPFPALGIRGAAVATLIAWAMGFVLVMYILVWRKKLIEVKRIGLEAFVHTARKILKIGLPAAGANMLTPIAAAIMTAIIADFGNGAVGAFGVGSRVESIASLVVLALSMSLPPLISQNFGAGRLDRVLEAYRATLKFVLSWQLAVYLLLVLTSGLIASRFSQEAEVRRLIELFIYILPLGYGLQGVIILTNSSFNALHLPMSALVLSIVRLFVFYVPFAYIGSRAGGIEGMFVGALLGNLCTAVVAYRWFVKQFELLSGQQEEVVDGA